MAYELIHDVHVVRGLWKDALDRPLDLDKLAALHARYHRGLRMNAVYSRICDEQHMAFMADLEAMRDRQRAEWQKLSKKDLCALLGYEYPTRLTTGDIIEGALFSRVQVEGVESRIKHVWEAMSEAEREGVQI